MIDLEENSFKTLSAKELLNTGYPLLKYLIQIESEGDYFTPRSLVSENELPHAVVNYDELLRRTPFAKNLSRALKLLEEHYHVPVDVEFTVDLPETYSENPVQITLLQCRPQSQLLMVRSDIVPANLKPDEIIFVSHYMIPQGYLSNIQYVISVDPASYFSLPTNVEREELTRIISQLNKMMGEKTFICVGPGRWGTANHDLGVFVNYSDIYNTGALVELSSQDNALTPESSFGTHFFQDLMEAQIYPVSIQMDDERTIFNVDFFKKSRNFLSEFVQTSERICDTLRLINVAAEHPDCHIEIVLDGDKNRAIAFLAPDQQ